MRNRKSHLARRTGAWMRVARCGWLFVLLSVLGGSSVLAQTPTGAVGVYYVGLEDAIAEAINLAAPYIVRVDQPELAQVLVLNDFLPRNEETLRLFSALAQRGDVGLVVFCGPQFPQTVEDLSALLGVGAFGMARRDNALPVQISSSVDALQRAVAWNAAPSIQARTIISNTNLLLPIVVTSAREPVLQRIRGREKAQAFIVGGWLTDPSNREWESWPYFRYLVYRLVIEAANTSRALPFANYPLSPVPQGTLRLGLIGGGAAAVFLSAWALYLARRRLFMRPDIWGRLRVTPRAPLRHDEWETVGFHRPLAGLLTLLLPYLLLLALVAAYQVDFLPRVLVPWEQTFRTWEITGMGLSAVWLLLDMGTGVAAVYYFATLRIRYPHEAFRYFQYYVWWQLLSGATQFGIAMTVATLVLPGAAQAYLAFYLVAHALIQFPGFFQGFRLFFRAIQRFDYEQYVALAVLIGTVVVQGSAVLLLRRWGAAQPLIGETLGAILGLGVGLYLVELGAFALGLVLYKRLGYTLRALFLPAFDRRIAGQMASFGGRLAFGAAFAALGAVAQALLLPRLLPAYNAMRSQWALAVAFAAVFDVLAIGLYNGLLPAMAEAHIQGYKTLLRYYISQSVHYGLWFSLFLFAVLYAVGERIIQGMVGTTAVDVIHWLLPVLLWGVFQWMAWSANQVIVALGHPALTSWLTIGEQVTRLGLVIVLVTGRGMVGLPIAFAGALMLRGLAAWWIVKRLAGRTHLYLWRSLFAPVLAAWMLYGILRMVGTWWWTPTFPASFALLLGGLLPGLALYGFITALLGGWSAGGIAELARATRISSTGWPLAWLLTVSVRLGAHISPLHGQFPTGLREMAEAEARAATLGIVGMDDSNATRNPVSEKT